MPSLLTIERKKKMAKLKRENYHGKRTPRYLAKQNWRSLLIGKEPIENIYKIYDSII